LNLLRALAPRLAYSYISFVGLTSRIRWEGLEHLEAAEKPGRGFIYAFWHQRQVLFTYTHRGKGASILVSRSKDGDIIAETMRLSGLLAVRGSSSRGAAQAAREMLDILDRGGIVGVSPDGPKGPAREVKAGALYLAQKSGRWILPIANAIGRRVELQKAWDHFHVPLPFSRICVQHGRPLRVLEGDDLEAKAAQLKEELDRITREADGMVA
jgi:lysophospholipid acyltransferase (LPLAT)-like uncharacterized protein